MKRRIYSEATGGDERVRKDPRIENHGFEDFNESWASPELGSLPYSGIDASPYTASLTPLHSPETPSLDQVFPPQMVDEFTHLDPLFGAYSPALGHLPLPRSSVSTTLSEGYSLSSMAPSPYLHANVWPPHVAPTTFLPTPPTATDQYSSDEESTTSSTNRKSSKSSAKRQPTQLRTASRAPKKRSQLAQRPAESTEDVKARAAHNQVEQQYRKRLNGYFEKLLEVLPEGEAGERRVSKAEVLDLARRRIKVLEKEMAGLQKERKELRGRICGLERTIGQM